MICHKASVGNMPLFDHSSVVLAQSQGLFYHSVPQCKQCGLDKFGKRHSRDSCPWVAKEIFHAVWHYVQQCSSPSKITITWKVAEHHSAGVRWAEWLPLHHLVLPPFSSLIKWSLSTHEVFSLLLLQFFLPSRCGEREWEAGWDLDTSPVKCTNNTGCFQVFQVSRIWYSGLTRCIVLKAPSFNFHIAVNNQL